MTKMILDWLTQARQAEKQQKHQWAMSCYHQVLALEPTHLDATKHLGLLLRREHAWEQVITLYKNYLKLHPSAVVYLWLSDAYEQYEQLEESLLAAAKSVWYFSRQQQPLTHTMDYFWWIKACLKVHQPDLALQVLQDSLSYQKSPIQHRLFESLVIQWVEQYLSAQPAQPLDALRLLLMLDQHMSLGHTMTHQAIKIAQQYAIYDETIQTWAWAICLNPRHEDEVIVDTAFDVLLCAQGISSQLLYAYELWRQHHHLTERFLSSYAQILLADQQFESLLTLVEQHPLLLSLSTKNPAIAWVKLRKNPEAVLIAERELWQSYQRIVEDSLLCWQQLAQASTSLAVVGNSPCELGLGQGNQIDQHDVVIRFNAFDLSAPYASDYGQRVDWVVRSAAQEDNLELEPCYENKTIVISYIGFLARFRRWSLVQRLQADGHRICCYPAQIHQGLIQTLKRSPSAGLSIVWLLKHFRQANTVGYYGFSFVDQIGTTATSAHYFEQALPSLRHAWRQEREYFEQWVCPLAPVKSVTRAGLPIKVVGDHKAYHCGSAAVMTYFGQEIERIGYLVKHGQYAALLVNGEDSMHHRSQAYLHKMRHIALALAQNKPVYLLNSVWQDNQSDDADLLTQLQQITLRDSLSQQDFQQITGQVPPVYLDCSFWASLDLAAPVVDFAKKTVCTDFYSTEFNTFVKVTGGLLSKYVYIDINQWSWSSLVLSLKSASLLVTGHHHAMYAACRARVPFVVMAGNTHNIEGLLAMTGLSIPICRHPRELRDAIIWARQNRAVYQQLFNWMDAQPRWQLSDFILSGV